MVTSLDIFLDTKTHIFLNPRLSTEVREKILAVLASPPLENHVWVASSGTESARTDSIKLVALSKKAFLIAADAVCKQFAIESSDVYLNVLPLFHVGGLATLARAVVSGCNLHSANTMEKWDPLLFCRQLQDGKVTVTSLVPTQIFDLVAQNQKAPPSLRFAFVGGGALTQELALKAKNFGWNLISTYGMTETAAMMAYGTSTLPSDVYTLLPHITDCRLNDSGNLQIQSEALFSGYGFVSSEGCLQFINPLENCWFTAGDRAIVRGREVQILGRESELVKIKGESVSLFFINNAFDNFCLDKNILCKKIIIALPDERSGFSLCLVTEKEISSDVLEEFNRAQLPYQRIHRQAAVAKIPLTPVGKVDFSSLRDLLADFLK